MASYEFEHDWPLTPITDPEEIERINKATGFVPLPKEKQAWISKYALQLFHEKKLFSTFALEKEYDLRKANGTLDDVFK